MTYDVSYTLKGKRKFAFKVTEMQANAILNRIEDPEAIETVRVDIFDEDKFIRTVDANWNEVKGVKTWKEL